MSDREKAALPGPVRTCVEEAILPEGRTYSISTEYSADGRLLKYYLLLELVAALGRRRHAQHIAEGVGFVAGARGRNNLLAGDFVLGVLNLFAERQKGKKLVAAGNAAEGGDAERTP